MISGVNLELILVLWMMGVTDADWITNGVWWMGGMWDEMF